MDIFYSEKGLTFENFIKYPEISIEENSFTFITGKSGCGKSSYLKMLNFTALPSDGKIYFCGKDLTELSPSITDARLCWHLSRYFSLREIFVIILISITA